MTDHQQENESPHQGLNPNWPWRLWGFTMAALAIGLLVRGLGQGPLDEVWPYLVWTIAGVVALLAVILGAMVVIGLPMQRRRLAHLVEKVRRYQPEAVIIPGVVETGVIRFPFNRPLHPGHVALAVLPDRVEGWDRYSMVPIMTVRRTDDGMSVQRVVTMAATGSWSYAERHLVFQDGEDELVIVPEYEVRFRANYPEDLARALRELGTDPESVS